MLHLAICDDDAAFLEEFSHSVAAILKDTTAYSLVKCKNAQQLLVAGPQDIVFLDIEMEGINGMEAARRLRGRGDGCRLVFVSAHPRYVFAAFDVEAAHFLVKPVEADKLRAVLLRQVERAAKEGQRYLAVRQGAGVQRVPLKDILYLEVYDRKVFIHTGEAVIDFYGRLEQLAQKLDGEFFRCHRSYIVHLPQIGQYNKNEITLNNGEKIPVARRKYPAFCQAFLRYLKEGGEAW